MDFRGSFIILTCYIWIVTPPPLACLSLLEVIIHPLASFTEENKRDFPAFNTLFYLYKDEKKRGPEKKSPVCLQKRCKCLILTTKQSLSRALSSTFSAIPDCQHYSSGSVSVVVIFEKGVKPHPAIVTVLWSITVTSGVALTVSTSLKSVKMIIGCFHFVPQLGSQSPPHLRLV